MFMLGKKITKGDTIYKWGRSLFGIIYAALEFNFGNEDSNSFYYEFTNHNTNDAGEELLPQTVHILIGEFKKFLLLSSIYLLNNHNECWIKLIDEQIVEGLTFCMTSVQLDRVWRQTILFNNRKYKQFCEEIFGGYIHRTVPIK